MLPFAAHRALRKTAGVAILLSIALPATTFPQRAAEQQIAANLQDEIRAAQLRDGDHSVDLIQPLAALGLVYEESGEPILAAAAQRLAVEIVRVNYGLHSLEQAPLIRRLIANAEAIGDHGAAWELEQGLLRLAARHPDDLRTARIMRDAADRRMDVLSRYDAGEFPPEVVLGCYYGGPHTIRSPADVTGENDCSSGTAHRVREGLVTEAQAYYSRAVGIILRNGRASSDELPPMLTALVESSYQNGPAALGRRSLTRLLAYRVSRSEPWLAQAEALVQIADWDLLHAFGRDQQDAALAEYAQADALLAQQGVAKKSIEAMFAPDAPVLLPTFLPNPLATGDDQEQSSYVVASFQIDRYGASRRVRILDASDDATRLVENRLVQLIARARFRPRLVDGRVAESAPFTVRYRFNASENAGAGWPVFWAPGEEFRRGVLLVDRQTVARERRPDE